MALTYWNKITRRLRMKEFAIKVGAELAKERAQADARETGSSESQLTRPTVSSKIPE